jgi:hypothetical protein
VGFAKDGAVSIVELAEVYGKALVHSGVLKSGLDIV